MDIKLLQKNLSMPVEIKTYLVIWIFLQLIASTTSYLGLCLINFPTTAYDCVVKAGYQNVSLLIDYTYNQNNISSAINSLVKAKNAGLGTSLGINFSVQNIDVANLVIKTIQKFPTNVYDSLWLMPYYAQSQPKLQKSTYSSSPPSQNCQKLAQITKYLKSSKISFGIATGSVRWAKYFQNQCDQMGQFPLYWIPASPDGFPSFDDFKPFAGWHTPSAKLYKPLAFVCGLSAFPYYFV